MDPRWLVEVPDVEAFMEQLEDADLEALVVDILERAGMSADVRWGADGVTVSSGGTSATYELPGDELAEVVQSALELAAHLVGERGFVLASAGLDSLQLAVVAQRTWDMLSEATRFGFGIVEPRMRLARARRPQRARIMN
jgi:hypothetical protein